MFFRPSIISDTRGLLNLCSVPRALLLASVSQIVGQLPYQRIAYRMVFFVREDDVQASN